MLATSCHGAGQIAGATGFLLFLPLCRCPSARGITPIARQSKPTVNAARMRCVLTLVVFIFWEFLYFGCSVDLGGRGIIKKNRKVQQNLFSDFLKFHLRTTVCES